MQLVWFRNDLRLDDHPALYHACRSAEPVAAVYVATPEQWRLHDEAAVKLGFRQAALRQLQDELAQLGISLTLLSAARFADIPALLQAHCQQQGVSCLRFNDEYPLDEQQRDQAVVDQLERAGIRLERYDADSLVSAALTTQQGETYKVFTPWYRRWLQQLSQELPQPLPAPQPVAPPLTDAVTPIHLAGAAEFREDLWPVQASRVHARLYEFVRQGLPGYSEQRDYPALKGTSLLSPYLASGLLSVRRCLSAIQQTAAMEGWDWRESDWLRELAWRQFYRYLMRNFPDLSRGLPFKRETSALQWQFDEGQHQAWCQGQTGFPIIDAGMRQLLRTGWMHNRLRMLTASFYSKLMLHDWHRGEQFFMQQLIDGDFPSNNGGWQWSASTGCDASPWFRVFNPYKQSERFDPQGDFIRKLVPELAGLDNREIHNPGTAVRQQLGYPAPIIDYKLARVRVLERFKAL